MVCRYLNEGGPVRLLGIDVYLIMHMNETNDADNEVVLELWSTSWLQVFYGAWMKKCENNTKEVFFDLLFIAVLLSTQASVGCSLLVDNKPGPLLCRLFTRPFSPHPSNEEQKHKFTISSILLYPAN